MAKSTAVFSIILFVSKVFSLSDTQCQNYKILNRDTERSRNNTHLPLDVNNVPCDDVIDGWYRFGSGEIATSCVPTNHCGTMSTIWMKDSVPNIGETRVNEFCVNHETGSNPNPCCLFSLHVNVTNCDGYMVYYFKGSNFLCPAGYCTGELKRCSPGQTSSTGYEPCNGVSYPVMYAPPVLQAPVIINNGHDLSQSCNVNYNGSLSDVAFKVTWLFDGAPYKTVTLTHGVASASLTSVDWDGNVGKKLSCSVDSYYTSEGPSNHSQILTSNEYFGGLLIIPTTNNITEGEHAAISVQSTLPLVCSNISLNLCKVNFDVTITSGNPDQIFFEDGCSVKLLAKNWDSISHKVEARAKFSTVVDPMQNADQLYTLSFNIRRDSLVPQLLDTQGPLEINVSTHDEEHHYCMVLGSEFVGLNKTQAYKIGFYTGDFLMYKDTSVSGKILQVQIRAWRQFPKSSSVCGVAFQYGDTLIKIDMCSSQPNITAPVVTQGKSHSDDVKTYLCGSSYEIVTAEGVRLSVLLNIQHLDLKLHIPPRFAHSWEGACSFKRTYDHFGSIDQTLYGLKDRTSLFEKAALPFYSNASKVNSAVSYCQCGSSKPYCNPFLHLNDPAAPFLVDSIGKETIKRGCKVVVPRSINPEKSLKEELYIKGEHKTFPYSSQQHNFIVCDTAIKLHSNYFCTQKYRTQEAFFRNICTKDMRLIGDVANNLPSIVQGFHWSCQEDALSKPTNYYNGNIPPDVTSDMCSSLCSLQGKCVHGVCVCNSGYEGVDCSVNKTTPPVILGVKGGNLCGLSSRYCLNPILITRNVNPGDALQVLVEARDVLSGSHQRETFHLDPVYENKYSISLQMAHTVDSLKLKDGTVIKFTMKITIDGGMSSQTYDYTVYDDKCQVCGIENACLQKENTCRIDGRCVLSYEVNPVNSSEICDPDRAMLHWTEVKKDHGMSSKGSRQVSIVGQK